MERDQNHEDRIRRIEVLLEGQPGAFGMIAKLEIIWRLHIPAFMAIGAAIGSLATLLVTKISG